MPTKTNQRATLYVGKDYTLNFTEVDSEDLSTFNEITYVFADSSTADSTYFTKTKSGGNITTAGSSNEVAQVTINGSDTANLISSPNEFYHELVTEDGSGNEQVAATGHVKLIPVQTDN